MGLLVAIALAATIEVGRRPAAYIHIHDDPNREEQLVAIRDGLFVLVSLLLGLTLALPVPPYNERFWLTLVLAPITIAIVVAQVADLDSPSTGLIRLDQRATQRLKAEFSSEPWRRASAVAEENDEKSRTGPPQPQIRWSGDAHFAALENVPHSVTPDSGTI